MCKVITDNLGTIQHLDLECSMPVKLHGEWPRSHVMHMIFDLSVLKALSGGFTESCDSLRQKFEWMDASMHIIILGHKFPYVGTSGWIRPIKQEQELPSFSKLYTLRLIVLTSIC